MGTDHKLIRSGSGLSLIGGFMDVFREIFHPEQDMSWVYEGNDATQASRTQPTIKPRTRIYILSAFDTATNIPSPATRLVVNKGSTATSKQGIANLDQDNSYLISKGYRYTYFNASTDIEIRVFTESIGECYQLIDLVQAVIAATQIEIAKFLHVNEISETVSTSVVPAENDRKEWTAALSFRVSHEERFFRAPDALLLRGIKMSTSVDDSDLAAATIKVPST